MCYCPFYRCTVVVTIRKHQWELLYVVDIQLFCVLSGHTRQLVCWRQNGVIMTKGCPPADTCKATVGQNQMGGREILDWSMSKQTPFISVGTVVTCAAMAATLFRPEKLIIHNST